MILKDKAIQVWCSTWQPIGSPELHYKRDWCLCFTVSLSVNDLNACKKTCISLLFPIMECPTGLLFTPTCHQQSLTSTRTVWLFYELFNSELCMYKMFWSFSFKHLFFSNHNASQGLVQEGRKWLFQVKFFFLQKCLNFCMCFSIK